MTVLVMLKMVWALAIWRGVSAASCAAPASWSEIGEILLARLASWSMNGSQSKTPMTLNRTCTVAARWASRGLPIAARSAVTQVPMLAPRINAIPAGSVMNPWLAMTMTTPVVAELDCTSAVNSAPARMPT